MLRKASHYFLLLTGLLFILALLVWNEHRINNNKARQFENAHSELQKLIIRKELDFIGIIQNELYDTTNILRRWKQITEIAEKKHVAVTVYEHKVPLLWTSNQFDPEPFNSSKDTFAFIQSENAYLIEYQVNRGPYTYLLSYVIKYNFAFHNDYIQNRFNDELSFIKEGVISPGYFENMVEVKGLADKPLFYIQLFSYAQQTPFWLVVLLVINMGGIIVLIHFLARKYIRSHFTLTTISFFSFWLLIRFINIYYHLPEFIYQFKLFTPIIYASSNWLPSLGDLLVDSTTILWYFVILESGKKRLHDYTAMSHFMRSITWFILSVSASHISISGIKSLTIDSQISFDISNVFTINFFSYVGLIIIVIQLLVVYFIVRNFARSLRAFKNQKQFNIIFGIGVGLLMYIALAHQFVHITTFQIGLTLLLFLFLLAFKSIAIKQNRFQQYFIVIFIIALISSLSIHHWVRLKEHESRKLYAVSLISQNDITTDYFLRNVEKKISTDPYVLNYFQNPLITKSQFEKRIRQIYFTGYLSKYEVNVLDYDSMGYHFRQRNPYTYRQINRMYEDQTLETINSHFRYIKNSAEVKGYIARFIMRRGRQVPGVLFILLKPKLIQDENRFDDLLIEGFRYNKKKDYNYSYAVYKDKFLIYQSGNFPYRTNNTWGDAPAARFFEEDEYEHLLFTDNQPLTVVVSKQLDSAMQVVGLFSFIFTCCTIVLIMILFIHVGLNAHSLTRYPWVYTRVVRPLQMVFNKVMLINKPETLYIRTRIQTSIIFILFITLVITSYFTINFITQKYNSRQTERLMKKVRNVVLTLENENIHNLDWQHSNEPEAFINQMADFYDTDIILYDQNGRVTASSISKIYDEGIIGRMMPSMAYYHLNLLRESQFTEDEHIALLNFQAAYAPVFRNKSEVLGYIQLPYFSQKADLISEISSIAVGFINLYVFLFIVIGLMAYLISRNISFPLTLIQRRLSQTVLIGKNEPIIWQRDDEIGELVQQYNSMITQLEESVRKLAETEREGAWREIARQIAHEIKNPLTPMKLSIQHLQRAFKNNDPNIAEKIDRTTKLLITQIDTLSDLASEFSSFAKMPAPVYDHINVCDILRQIKELYSLQSDTQFTFECDVKSLLYFDSSYLQRIVGNLVKNAMQAIPEGRQGIIDMNAKEDNETVSITVKDNGKGMTAQEASSIFLPYFSTKINGMGLGLPIVKNMIESGKGSITFQTIPGEGTTFIVTLPLKG